MLGFSEDGSARKRTHRFNVAEPYLCEAGAGADLRMQLRLERELTLFTNIFSDISGRLSTAYLIWHSLKVPPRAPPVEEVAVSAPETNF